MMHKQTIHSGLYLVIDPATAHSVLMQKLDTILKEDIAAVQIWDNFLSDENIIETIRSIAEKCNAVGVPVLINNRWDLLKDLALSGVHFDNIPTDIASIKAIINRPFLTGITCNNDLHVVQWAADHQFNYISFCSMFPSTTSNSCELVQFETVQQARQISNIPIFLAGGIRPGNLQQLDALPYDGIAVVSGVISAEDPRMAAKAYITHLKNKQSCD